jgi:hypothetical protein
MSQDGFQDTIQSLKAFFRHPLEEVARLPNWGLKRTLIVQALLAGISGALAGVFPPGLWKILQGLILFPILVTVMSALLASFFYYYFQIFERRTVSYPRLLTLIAFASFPFFLFHIPSTLFPFADLFGLAMMGILLAIGLTENFMMEKRRALRLVGVVFGLLFVLWLAERISSSTRLRMPDSVEDVE